MFRGLITAETQSLDVAFLNTSKSPVYIGDQSRPNIYVYDSQGYRVEARVSLGFRLLKPEQFQLVQPGRLRVGSIEFVVDATSPSKIIRRKTELRRSLTTDSFGADEVASTSRHRATTPSLSRNTTNPSLSLVIRNSRRRWEQSRASRLSLFWPTAAREKKRPVEQHIDLLEGRGVANGWSNFRATSVMIDDSMSEA